MLRMLLALNYVLYCRYVTEYSTILGSTSLSNYIHMYLLSLCWDTPCV